MEACDNIRKGLRDYAELSQQLNDYLASDEGKKIKACMDALEAKKKDLYDLAKAEAIGGTIVEAGYQLVVATRTTVDTHALFKAHGEAIAKACPEAVTLDKAKFARAQKAIASLTRKSASQKEVLGISIERFAGDISIVPTLRRAKE